MVREVDETKYISIHEHELDQKILEEDLFYNITKSICPKCKETIDAQIVVRKNKVLMRKRCPNHGWFESLISSDFEYYRAIEKYNKPGIKKLAYQTETKEGCPSDCGICPEHKQHTCLAIIEITNRCNMNCPICFANAGREEENNLPIDVIEGMIDNLTSSESNQVEIIQISGGEPSIHPNLLDIVRKCKERGIENVMLNTNGRKFASDQNFAHAVKDAGLNAVYLQFDGFEENTFNKLRGNPNLLKEKLHAIENLFSAGITITLIMTVVKGINDHEIGEILRFVHETEGIMGVSFQPLFAAGRFNLKYDPLDHLTTVDIIKLIENQSDLYTKEDFFSIPCPEPHCSACTFSYIDPDTNEFTTIKRLVEVEDYLDYFANSTLPINASQAVKDAIEGLFSMATTPGSIDLVEGYCTACGIDLNIRSIQKSFKKYLKHLKMVMIKPFMSAYDLDIKRLMKCCIHQVLPDGKIIPFCAFNTIYRENYDLKKFM
ncbi:MAG: radical SAM protein [Candidatus Hodarchaeales archaeon]